MAGLVPYLHFDGVARQALEFYREIFGGQLVLHTRSEFSAPGNPDGIAHGMLRGPVELFAADTGPGEAAFAASGLLLSLLGTTEPDRLERWFAALAEDGEVVDPLQARPWGDHDGRVRDRFGLEWLIGYAG